MKDTDIITLNKMFSGPMKPRVMSSYDLMIYILKFIPGKSIQTLYRHVKVLVACGNLKRITNNLYANMQAIPKISPNEVAEHIEENAIVTLHSALTHAGALNNPPRLVTAMVPVDFKRWKGGVRTTLHTEFSDYWFFRVPKEVAVLEDVPEHIQLVQDVSYRMAKPEKALADWIYVAVNSRIKSPDGLSGFPPLDLDMEKINLRNFSRIVKAMGIEQHAREWLLAKNDHDSSENVRMNMSVGMGF